MVQLYNFKEKVFLLQQNHRKSQTHGFDTMHGQGEFFVLCIKCAA